ncbi:L,D-transpeptidase [Phyllobacterium sp. 0TCS1.6C]|jgi:lipoprotein-anchoring transpeptidase ErfK/SrfK|uniref:L,D-transpeptidase n=1 Tax=unclassified Phyllobacterium TaxID=2638441 RepID=UPI002263F57B|nr:MULTISPECIES: L,D-transpeptidase [unclassified Phyllobacterium]MCX8281304.1 L,D-transpeptidase [Phyllobacterium sp. 0TCS1.6C]MCX8296040.1 L,D-transpeptidase [Phyllobacterium sp. 0TCS1.6A]
MQNTLSRRGFLTALTATAAAGLAGCAQIRSDMPVIRVDDYGNPLTPQTDVDPALGSFEAMYAAREDGGFLLPAIPISKMDKRYLRQIVRDPTGEQPGTIVVDTQNKFCYLVRENGEAIRYGVGIGRDGFAWSGRAVIQWKRHWPKWTPPDEMVARQPELAQYSAANGGMQPGLNNPLGSRALYIFQNGEDTLYRLHGSPEWWSIGKAVSSGCVRFLNQDIIDLYDRVPNKTPIVVI